MTTALEQRQIYTETRALERFEHILQSESYSKLFFLTDENTHEHCLYPLLREFSSLPDYEVLEVEPGEDSKSPEVLHQLWLALADLGADRHSLLVNVGGGVVTDLGGFLAATYNRGIDLINFPTSLLAMVDASTGGKTGINLEGIKNRIGSFYNPKMVGIYPKFLETLPENQRRSGFAEMLKHGLIASPDHFRKLCAIKPGYEPDSELIAQSIALKDEVVQSDPREQGRRKILNFGHTIGHAIETESHRQGKPLLHGEAVAYGMEYEVALAEKLGVLPAEAAREIKGVVQKHFAVPPLTWDVDQLLQHIEADKKNRHGKLRFALIEDIGRAIYDVEVEPELVKEVLAP